MKIVIFTEPISCLDDQLFLLEAFFNIKMAETKNKYRLNLCR